ncbi:MAG TPA: PLP-dependent transferase [Gaiellaceae bacterium]|nr:PLP-dependent transferase [Gaiellaceae bacterium]
MGRDEQAGGAIGTLAVHGGERRPGPEASLVFPIYQAAVFASEPDTDYHDIKYPRLSTTPSHQYLHAKLAALEGGEAAVATASGMAAVTAILLSLLRNGDHFLVSDCLYGGTHDFITHHAGELGWSYDFVDARDPSSWAAAKTAQTRLFLVETISNPLIRVPDLLDVLRFARHEGLTSVIDNTFASPVNFRPLEVGFDLVCHSATKYLNGHSDICAGCVVGPVALVERVRKTLNHYGGSLDAHACFLLARGLKTLAVRVRVQNANADALARFLADHPQVTEVNYPGLPASPDHGRAAELFSGFGGVLSFRLRGGAEAAQRMLAALRIPSVAPSLGSVETLITVPALTSHAGMSAEDRDRIGVGEDLVRVSCGIEDAQDLIDDFRRALDEAADVAGGEPPAVASGRRDGTTR